MHNECVQTRHEKPNYFLNRSSLIRIHASRNLSAWFSVFPPTPIPLLASPVSSRPPMALYPANTPRYRLVHTYLTTPYFTYLTSDPWKWCYVSDCYAEVTDATWPTDPTFTPLSEESSICFSTTDYGFAVSPLIISTDTARGPATMVPIMINLWEWVTQSFWKSIIPHYVCSLYRFWFCVINPTIVVACSRGGLLSFRLLWPIWL